MCGSVLCGLVQGALASTTSSQAKPQYHDHTHAAQTSSSPTLPVALRRRLKITPAPAGRVPGCGHRQYCQRSQQSNVEPVQQADWPAAYSTVQTVMYVAPVDDTHATSCVAWRWRIMCMTAAAVAAAAWSALLPQRILYTIQWDNRHRLRLFNQTIV